MKYVKHLALVMGLCSFSALSDPIKLDHDNDGDFLEVGQLNLVANPNNYLVTQFLGADGIFSNGDAFSEFVHFDVSSFSNGAGGVFNLLDADLMGTGLFPDGNVAMHVVADVSGVVSNVSTDFSLIDSSLFTFDIGGNLIITPAGLADTDGDGATDFEEAAFEATDFKINFTAGSIGLYLDAANGDASSLASCTISSCSLGQQIGLWDVTTGSGDTVADNNGRPTTDFGVNLDFNQDFANANPFVSDIWTKMNGESLFGSDGTDLLALFTALINDTASPVNVVDKDNNGTEDYLSIFTTDTGGSMVFNVPEPTSLAIMGLGFLALGAAGRKKAK